MLPDNHLTLPVASARQVMDLLLEGARTLGRTVCEHIESLRGELDSACPWLELTAEEPTDEEVAAYEPRGAAAETRTTERMDHGVIQNRSVAAPDSGVLGREELVSDE